MRHQDSRVLLGRKLVMRLNEDDKIGENCAPLWASERLFTHDLKKRNERTVSILLKKYLYRF
jgi:hypothetical protein